MLSIISNRKTKSLVEKTAAIIFRGCAVMSIIAVVSITGYMIISGTPAIFKVGILDILLELFGRQPLLILNLESF